MKPQDIFNAIGNIDDKYISEFADTAQFKKKKIFFLSPKFYGSIAAVFIAGVAVFTVLQMNNSSVDIQNNQTNHFLVVQNAEMLAKLTSLAEAAFAKMTVNENTYPSLKNSILASQKGGYVFNYRAPVLIIVANRKDYGNNMADSVAAIENMMIAANALDLGSCYINQLYWLNEDPALLTTLRELGLKEEERVYASMTLGYAAAESGLPNRKPLERKGNEVTFI